MGMERRVLSWGSHGLGGEGNSLNRKTLEKGTGKITSEVSLSCPHGSPHQLEGPPASP